MDMSQKEALAIVLETICCQNGKLFCNENHCPRANDDCVKIPDADEYVLSKAIRTVKEMYENM